MCRYKSRQWIQNSHSIHLRIGSVSIDVFLVPSVHIPKKNACGKKRHMIQAADFPVTRLQKHFEIQRHWIQMYLVSLYPVPSASSVLQPNSYGTHFLEFLPCKSCSRKIDEQHFLLNLFYITFQFCTKMYKSSENVNNHINTVMILKKNHQYLKNIT